MSKILLISLATCSLLFSQADARFYGGYSSGELNLAKSSVYSAPLVVTEKVFVAKDSSDIDEVVKEIKKEDIASGKVAKEFTNEQTGHLYHGYSQGKLNF